MAKKAHPRLPNVKETVETENPTMADLFCLPKVPGLKPDGSLRRTFVIDLMAPGSREHVDASARGHLAKTTLDATFYSGDIRTMNIVKTALTALGVDPYVEPHDAFVFAQQAGDSELRQLVTAGLLEVALDLEMLKKQSTQFHILIGASDRICIAMGIAVAIGPADIIRCIVHHGFAGWKVTSMELLPCPL